MLPQAQTAKGIPRIMILKENAVYDQYMRRLNRVWMRRIKANKRDGTDSRRHRPCSPSERRRDARPPSVPPFVRDIGSDEGFPRQHRRRRRPSRGDVVGLHRSKPEIDQTGVRPTSAPTSISRATASWAESRDRNRLGSGFSPTLRRCHLHDADNADVDVPSTADTVVSLTASESKLPRRPFSTSARPRSAPTLRSRAQLESLPTNRETVKDTREDPLRVVPRTRYPDQEAKDLLTACRKAARDSSSKARWFVGRETEDCNRSEISKQAHSFGEEHRRSTRGDESIEDLGRGAVVRLIGKLGMGRYAHRFRAFAVTGSDLASCSESDLLQIGVSFRPHRLRLLREIDKRRSRKQSGVDQPDPAVRSAGSGMSRASTPNGGDGATGTASAFVPRPERVEPTESLVMQQEASTWPHPTSQHTSNARDSPPAEAACEAGKVSPTSGEDALHMKDEDFPAAREKFLLESNADACRSPRRGGARNSTPLSHGDMPTCIGSELAVACGKSCSNYTRQTSPQARCSDHDELMTENVLVTDTETALTSRTRGSAEDGSGSLKGTLQVSGVRTGSIRVVLGTTDAFLRVKTCEQLKQIAIFPSKDAGRRGTDAVLSFSVTDQALTAGGVYVELCDARGPGAYDLVASGTVPNNPTRQLVDPLPSTAKEAVRLSTLRGRARREIETEVRLFACAGGGEAGVCRVNLAFKPDAIEERGESALDGRPAEHSSSFSELEASAATSGEGMNMAGMRRSSLSLLEETTKHVRAIEEIRRQYQHLRTNDGPEIDDIRDEAGRSQRGAKDGSKFPVDEPPSVVDDDTGAQRNAVVMLQSHTRRRAARKVVKIRIKERTAAKRLQAFARQRRAMSSVRQARERELILMRRKDRAAVRLQCSARRRLAVKEATRRRSDEEQALAVSARRTRAAIRVHKFIRHCLLCGAERKHCAAARLQGMLKVRKAKAERQRRRECMAEEERQEQEGYAVKRIQEWARRLRLASDGEHQVRAAIMIQSLARWRSAKCTANLLQQERSVRAASASQAVAHALASALSQCSPGPEVDGQRTSAVVPSMAADSVGKNVANARTGLLHRGKQRGTAAAAPQLHEAAQRYLSPGTSPQDLASSPKDTRTRATHATTTKIQCSARRHASVREARSRRLSRETEKDWQRALFEEEQAAARRIQRLCRRQRNHSVPLGIDLQLHHAAKAPANGQVAPTSPEEEEAAARVQGKKQEGLLAIRDDGEVTPDMKAESHAWNVAAGGGEKPREMHSQSSISANGQGQGSYAELETAVLALARREAAALVLLGHEAATCIQQAVRSTIAAARTGRVTEKPERELSRGIRLDSEVRAVIEAERDTQNARVAQTRPSDAPDTTMNGMLGSDAQSRAQLETGAATCIQRWMRRLQACDQTRAVLRRCNVLQQERNVSDIDPGGNAEGEAAERIQRAARHRHALRRTDYLGRKRRANTQCASEKGELAHRAHAASSVQRASRGCLPANRADTLTHVTEADMQHAIDEETLFRKNVAVSCIQRAWRVGQAHALASTLREERNREFTRRQEEGELERQRAAEHDAASCLQRTSRRRQACKRVDRLRRQGQGGEQCEIEDKDLTRMSEAASCIQRVVLCWQARRRVDALRQEMENEMERSSIKEALARRIEAASCIQRLWLVRQARFTLSTLRRDHNSQVWHREQVQEHHTRRSAESEAAERIQRAARCHRAVKRTNALRQADLQCATDEEDSARERHAASCIQRAARCRQAVKRVDTLRRQTEADIQRVLEEEDLARKYEAASCIQRTWRVRQARALSSALREERTRESKRRQEERELDAVSCIQRSIRYRQAVKRVDTLRRQTEADMQRVLEEEDLARKYEAASCIQRTWRVRQARALSSALREERTRESKRRQEERELDAVSCIQRAARCRQAVKRVDTLRRQTEADTQRVLGEEDLARKYEAASCIQRAWRVRQARALSSALREERTRESERRQEERELDAVSCIQRAARCRQAVKRVDTLRRQTEADMQRAVEEEEDLARKYEAASCIQRAWRVRQARALSSALREERTRESKRRQEERELDAVSCIQRAARCRQAVKRVDTLRRQTEADMQRAVEEEEDLARKYEAASCIQRAARCRQAVKRAETLRQQTEADTQRVLEEEDLARKYEAASCIQRAWRARQARALSSALRAKREEDFERKQAERELDQRRPTELDAVSCIQRSIRYRQAVKRVDTRRQGIHFDRQQAMDRLLVRQTEAASRIQRVALSRQARMRIDTTRQRMDPDMRRSLGEGDLARRIEAASCIQRSWRTRQARASVSALLEERNGKRSRRHEQRELDRRTASELEAAERIQRAARHRFAVKQGDDLKKRVRASLPDKMEPGELVRWGGAAACIQRSWRTRQARARASMLQVERTREVQRDGYDNVLDGSTRGAAEPTAGVHLSAAPHADHARATTRDDATGDDEPESISLAFARMVQAARQSVDMAGSIGDGTWHDNASQCPAAIAGSTLGTTPASIRDRPPQELSASGMRESEDHVAIRAISAEVGEGGDVDALPAAKLAASLQGKSERELASGESSDTPRSGRSPSMDTQAATDSVGSSSYESATSNADGPQGADEHTAYERGLPLQAGGGETSIEAPKETSLGHNQENIESCPPARDSVRLDPFNHSREDARAGELVFGRHNGKRKPSDQESPREIDTGNPHLASVTQSGAQTSSTQHNANLGPDYDDSGMPLNQNSVPQITGVDQAESYGKGRARDPENFGDDRDACPGMPADCREDIADPEERLRRLDEHSTGWETHVDETTRRLYYYHPVSGITSWVDPRSTKHQSLTEHGQDLTSDEVVKSEDGKMNPPASSFVPLPLQHAADETVEERTACADGQNSPEAHHSSRTAITPLENALARRGEYGQSEARWSQADTSGLTSSSQQPGSPEYTSLVGEGDTSEAQAEWQQAFDEVTGADYFYNTVTRQSMWNVPAGLTLAVQPAGDATTGVNKARIWGGGASDQSSSDGGVVHSATGSVNADDL